MKVINIDNNSSRTEDTRSSRGAKKIDDNLMVTAAESGIKEIEKELKNYYTPKGYILKAKRKGGTYIFETTLGTDKINKGDNLDIYSVKNEENPLTGDFETIEYVIAKGKVSDKSNEKRSWIVVKEGGPKVKLGDYIKVVYKKGMLDAFGAGKKFWNKASE